MHNHFKAASRHQNQNLTQPGSNSIHRRSSVRACSQDCWWWRSEENSIH